MVEHADGEQTSVVFLGRESFRIERKVSTIDGAIPTPISDTPTGRIFDRRRVPRNTPAAPSPRRTRSVVALLVITFAGGVALASAIAGMRTHVAARPPKAVVAAPPPVVPAAVVQTPPAPPAPVRQPPPADEPTPAANEARPAPTSTIPDRPAAVPPAPRPARPARPAVRSTSPRIVPPTRPWVDPFAG